MDIGLEPPFPASWGCTATVPLRSWRRLPFHVAVDKVEAAAEQEFLDLYSHGRAGS